LNSCLNEYFIVCVYTDSTLSNNHTSWQHLINKLDMILTVFKCLPMYVAILTKLFFNNLYITLENSLFCSPVGLPMLEWVYRLSIDSYTNLFHDISATNFFAPKFVYRKNAPSIHPASYKGFDSSALLSLSKRTKLIGKTHNHS